MTASEKNGRQLGAGNREESWVWAIASGKGGTGKTTVSLNLAQVMGRRVQVLDCDVEEPNAHLFLAARMAERETVTVSIPRVDASKCDGCGECSAFCEFNAIGTYGRTALVFPEMCHGCGGCRMVCPQDAIDEVEKSIGVVEVGLSEKIMLIQGRLDIGVAMAPPLIDAVKNRMLRDLPAILDAPPGISCPVISTLRGADFVILVTEPTPFGLHDLQLAVELVRRLDLPHGVVVNRVGVGDDRVHRYCTEEGLAILLEIPDDRRVAEAYSKGEFLVNALPEYRPLFELLMEKLMALNEGGMA